ncbi:hypothetical protein EV660_1123 [Roseinatronobacter bogoriensis DSM 18756]|nr:hypothetical protein [Rhodobaca bogoriensis DSM 18756]TDY66266.1 hypothetical protein EV660_1123 [Rhodobaca bogoriensis DSM 18756]
MDILEFVYMLMVICSNAETRSPAMHEAHG